MRSEYLDHLIGMASVGDDLRRWQSREFENGTILTHGF
jgi:hypothetical protein